MKDDNWELITGDDAHEIEVLNYSSQINVIEAMVRFIIHHHGVSDNGCPGHPSEKALQELHRTGTLFLLRAPGEYREEQVYVMAGTQLIHTPPNAADVSRRMSDTFIDLAGMWNAASPIEIGAYAAVFDRVDRGGDVVRAGAFGRPGAVPLLWQHGGAPVGTVETVGEDAQGLRVIGRIDEPRLAALVQAGAVDGLSFGYRVRGATRGRVRELTALELVEVSLVAQPARGAAPAHCSLSSLTLARRPRAA